MGRHRRRGGRHRPAQGHHQEISTVIEAFITEATAINIKG